VSYAGSRPPNHIRDSTAENLVVTDIRDRNGFSAALSQPRAFLFLWVNWAIQALSSRRVVEKAITAWQSEYPHEPVPFYVVDVSDQSGEIWDALAEWLTAEGCPAGHLMMSGSGPLLWLRAGHVVFHVLAPLQFSPAELALVCGSAFKADDGP
jgi:hypothetical protein